MTLLGEMLVADGEKKGLQRGRIEGRMEGRQEGELLKLISLIRKKTLKMNREEEIADLLEEDISVVRKICGILKQDSGLSDEAVYAEYMRQQP